MGNQHPQCTVLFFGSQVGPSMVHIYNHLEYLLTQEHISFKTDLKKMPCKVVLIQYSNESQHKDPYFAVVLFTRCLLYKVVLTLRLKAIK